MYKTGIFGTKPSISETKQSRAKITTARVSI